MFTLQAFGFMMRLHCVRMGPLMFDGHENEIESIFQMAYQTRQTLTKKRKKNGFG